MSDAPVICERRAIAGGDTFVQWITLNRETHRNAVNAEMLATLQHTVEAAMDDPNARAIVLTGTGDKAFCAGADLAKGTKGFAFDVDYAHPQHYFVKLFRLLETCNLPVIARINGHVMAGGFGLLCAADLAVAADDIRFGTPEAKIGVTPMMILPYMLRVIPPRKLQEMCITGEAFTARELLEWGVVNYVVPRAELDAKVDWLIGRIVDKSPTSIRLGKQAFHAMRDMTLPQALEYAQAMVPVMSSTEDVKEGLAAFREKRVPRFSGR
ncbi:MAG: enoyl-CoA hydratase/isomerase family protein [Nevskiaceae bacterium]|nr:MAG: enoyl-CoA hydratase/isomerase family protein [Nevskiaceae bacterium]TBR72536.1 MAG: enoyl-CoA hydratase/isomerase family protein [Nevskiaceae bacterium]